MPLCNRTGTDSARLPVVCLALMLVAAGSLPATAQELRLLQDLRGPWKFEIGDDSLRANPEFDDRKWAEIKVPGRWEDQGFPGVRRLCLVSEEDMDPGRVEREGALYEARLCRRRGRGVLNGTFVAFTGEFPPHYVSAYNWTRQYPLPNYALKYGAENLIAVRVYDSRLEGGITRGEVALYERRDMIPVVQDLSGMWKFSAGDMDGVAGRGL